MVTECRSHEALSQIHEAKAKGRHVEVGAPEGPQDFCLFYVLILSECLMVSDINAKS